MRAPYIELTLLAEAVGPIDALRQPRWPTELRTGIDTSGQNTLGAFRALQTVDKSIHYKC